MFAFSNLEEKRALWQEGLFLLSMIGILLFLNWAPSGGALPVWDLIHRFKYLITAAFAVLLLYSILRWFQRDELGRWVGATRDFAVQILPLLFAGVLVAGFLLGRPGHRALIPENWIAALVGGNSLRANLVAALAGELGWKKTLTYVLLVVFMSTAAGLGYGLIP